MVFVDVHTVLFAAFKCNTWARCFCQAINIICPNAQQILNVLPHFFCPWFCTENTSLQVVIFRLVSLFFQCFADVCRIGWRTAENGRLQIHHELNLPFCITRGHRQRQTSNLMRTAIQTCSACKQAISIANLADIFICSTYRSDCSCTAILPKVNVMLGIECNHSSASCARG